MSGYTAVYPTIFTGTLHAKWPDCGLWLCLLAMADRHGFIDCTPPYIASTTGLGLDEVVACLERFMAPDPHSRSSDHEGRRLLLIDPARPWGWRIVNYAKYRERQRRQAWDAQRTASGRDAERKRAQREESRDVPTRPDASRQSPLSSASASASASADSELAAFNAAYPKRSGSQPWKAALKAVHARLKEGHEWSQIIDGAHRYAAYCRATGKIATEYVMQAARFCGPEKHFLEAWELPATKADRRLASNADAAAEFMANTEDKR